MSLSAPGKLLVLACLFVVKPAALADSMNGFDLSNSRVAISEIAQGGPPKDGIPAIDHPVFEAASSATWLQPDDRVLGIQNGQETKAYPVRILNWHEVVNDQLGNLGILVSYCPLCGTGMAFRSEVAGSPLTFGVSGLLYRSDVLFYDRQTQSLWSQLDRVGISGANRDQPLVQLPMEHTTWAAWRTAHPQTLVLSRDQGFSRDYMDNPYAGYESTRKLFFQVAAQIPTNYHTKERVLGLSQGEQAIALPFSELRNHGKATFTLEFAGRTYTVEWNKEQNTARVLNADGKVAVHTIAFWFAWFAFHPQTEIFVAE